LDKKYLSSISIFSKKRGPSMNKTIFILIIAFVFILMSLNGYAANQSVALTENWGIKKIEADKSWHISQSNKKIIVAIIDTGIDIHHPVLKNNIWINPKEIPNNGIDDDKNGFVDDINGWNFVAENNKPFDSHGHGTHIAGIVKSVAPQVSIMVLKYFDPKSLSDKNLSNTVKAINYAVQNGAQIINYSGGGFGKNPLEKAAIQRAKDQNILFVAAAGNESVDSDKDPFYPADYDLPNIVSVASLTQESNLVGSSNFGIRTVDIAAPGKEILSTLPGGRYGRMTGTSQATAFVTGALAILLDANPNIQDPRKIIEYLVKTGNIEENLNGKTKYRTQLNSYRSLVMKGRDLNAGGFAVENTKHINSDFFSSDTAILESSLDSLIKSINHKNRIRIPAQQ
jgi:subtilisin family serine protease